MLGCVFIPAFIWFVVGLGTIFWAVTAGAAVCMAAALTWGMHATSANR